MPSNNIGSASIQVGADASHFSSDVLSQTKGLSAKLASSLKSVGTGAMTALGTVLKGAGAVVGGLVGVQIGKSMAKGWSRLQGLDSAKARMKGLGIVGKALDGVMTSVGKSVDGTSFSLDAAAASASLLLTSGVKAGKGLDSALGSLVAVATAAGGTSENLASVTGVFQKMATGGKVTGDALSSLSEQGINASALLAKSLDKPQEAIAKMVKNGQISFEQFNKAVQDEMGGMALAVGSSYTAMQANFFSRLGKAAANIEEPFFDAGKRILSALLPKTSDLGAATKVLTDTITKKIEPWVTKIIGWIDKIDFSKINLKGFTALLGPLAPLLGLIAGKLGGVASGIPVIGKLFTGMTGPIGLVSGALISMFKVDPKKMAAGFDNLAKTIPAMITKILSGVGSGGGMVSKLISNFRENLPVIAKGVAKIASASFRAVLNALPGPFGTTVRVAADKMRMNLTAAFGGKTPIEGWGKSLYTMVAGGVKDSQAVIRKYSPKIRRSLADAFDMPPNATASWGNVAEAGLDKVKSSLSDFGNIVKDSFSGFASNAAPGFGKLFDAIKPIIGMLPTLLAAFSPVKLIFDALKPLLPTISKMLGSFVGIIGTFLAGALKAVTPLLTTIVGVIQQLIPFVTQLVASLLPPLNSLFKSLAPLLSLVLAAILPIIQSIASALIPIVKALMPVVKTVFTLVAGYIKSAMAVFQGIIDFLKAVFSGNWSAAWKAVKDIFSSVWNGIKDYIVNLWKVIISYLKYVWEAIKGAVKVAWELVKKFIVDPLKSLWSWIQTNFITPMQRGLSNAWAAVKNAVVSAWNAVVKFIKDTLSAAWRWVNDSFIAPLKRGFSIAWESVKTATSKAWGFIKTAIIDPLKRAWAWVNDSFIAPIKRAFNATWTWARDTFSKAWNGFYDKIISPFSKAFDWIRDKFIEPIKKVINGIWTWAKNTFSKAWNGLKKIFTDPIALAKATIDTLWGGIKNIFASGVNKVIDVVNWFIPLINKIPFIDIDQISHVGMSRGGMVGTPTVGSEMARGGIVGGGRDTGRDETLVPMRFGEGVLVPRAVAALGGAKGIARLNHTAGYGTISGRRSPRPQKGQPGFSWGGVFGAIGNFFKGAWDNSIGAVKLGYKMITHPIKFIQDQFNKIVPKGMKDVFKNFAPAAAKMLLSWLPGAHGNDAKLAANPPGSDTALVGGGSIRPRLNYWNIHKPPNGYSQSTYSSGPDKNQYRNDCSGFISMLTGMISNPSTSEMSSNSRIANPIQKGQLKFGDVLAVAPAGGNSGHVVMFDHWMDDAQKSYFSHGFGSGVEPKHSTVPYPYGDGRAFKPYHLKNVLEGAAKSAMVPGGSGVSRWVPMMTRVISQKLGSKMVGTILPIMAAQMKNESGGNPQAQNNTDINAQRGTPSKGLLQFIQGTFNRYADPGFNSDIWDPESQMRAFINYVPTRYGSFNYLTRIGNKAYDSGGWLPTGYSMAYNGTGKPERVVAPHQEDDWSNRSLNISVNIDTKDLKGLRDLEDFVNMVRVRARSAAG